MAKPRFIVVIGASAGGAIALPDLLRQFKPEMNIAVFIVLHLSKRPLGDMLIERLQQHTSFKCKLPRHNEVIKSRHIYLARPNCHMLIKGDKILIGKGPMENRYRPSIDTLFRSSAVEYGSYVIGIVLSGLLEDGASGMMAVRRSGGTCIIQHPDEAKYPDMPLSITGHLKPDFSIPIQEMGEAISESMAKSRKKTKIPEDLKQEALIAERVQIGIDQLKEISTHSLYSCPDCGGGLWEINANGEKNYRCHVGHAFTEQNLLGAMAGTTEAALWTALRIIEERKNLLKGLMAKEKSGRIVITRYKTRIVELEKQTDQIKKVLFNTQND